MTTFGYRLGIKTADGELTPIGRETLALHKKLPELSDDLRLRIKCARALVEARYRRVEWDVAVAVACICVGGIAGKHQPYTSIPEELERFCQGPDSNDVNAERCGRAKQLVDAVCMAMGITEPLPPTGSDQMLTALIAGFVDETYKAWEINADYTYLIKGRDLFYRQVPIGIKQNDDKAFLAFTTDTDGKPSHLLTRLKPEWAIEVAPQLASIGWRRFNATPSGSETLWTLDFNGIEAWLQTQGPAWRSEEMTATIAKGMSSGRLWYDAAQQQANSRLVQQVSIMRREEGIALDTNPFVAMEAAFTRKLAGEWRAEVLHEIDFGLTLADLLGAERARELSAAFHKYDPQELQIGNETMVLSWEPKGTLGCAEYHENTCCILELPWSAAKLAVAEPVRSRLEEYKICRLRMTENGVLERRFHYLSEVEDCLRRSGFLP